MPNGLKKVNRSWAGSVEIQTADLGPASTLVLPQANIGFPRLMSYQQTITFGQFTDGGGAAGTKDLATSVPAGARYAFTLITGLTGFTGDTSAVIIIGDGTDTDRYMTGTPNVFVTAAAGVDMGVASGTAFHSAAKTPTVTITSGSDWGLVVAGAVTITMFWYQAS